MFNELLTKFLIWRLKHIPIRNFVFILAGVIGLITGIAAVTLKTVVHYIQGFLKSGFEFANANIYYVFYPLIGIVLTVVIAKFVFKDYLGHGVTDIIYSISKKSSVIAKVKMWSRMVTSAITVGFGGSVGLEAPIAITGSAIGSNISRAMHLNHNKRTLMIGCGAAGGVAAIFDAPIGGVIFAIEIILAQATIQSFIPLLISSVTASLVSKFTTNNDIIFSFSLVEEIRGVEIPYYIVLGVLCGLISVYFSRVVPIVENKVGSISSKYRPWVGGVLLGAIIFIFPPLYGEGYDSIIALTKNNNAILHDSLFFSQLSNESFILLFTLFLVLFKPIASALTLGSGGSGGIFAPSLVVGGYLGFSYSSFVNQIGADKLLSVNNFILVGMCGVMSGVQYAPLTAIFLIAEITNGYTLFIPLMIVSAMAYSTASYFEPHSIYTKRLIQRGELIRNNKDKQVLSMIHMRKLIETDLLTISPNSNLKDLIKLVSNSKRNIFPVVDEEGVLHGIVTLDDIRSIMFDIDAHDNVKVEELMQSPPSEVYPNESMDQVMKKFEISGAWNLPVIEHGKYKGFLSKSRIFNTYRNKIRQTQES
jgi:CIC family chloride channel protein